MERATGVKAVDVLAARLVRGERTLLLAAEMKDFSDPAVPEQYRPDKARQALSDQVMGVVVRKVVDSLCGATYAHDSTGRRCRELRPWRTALSTADLAVFYFVGLPNPASIESVTWTTELKKRLGWLVPFGTVFVITSNTTMPEIGLSYTM